MDSWARSLVVWVMPGQVVVDGWVDMIELVCLLACYLVY